MFKKEEKSLSAMQIVCFKVGPEEYGIEILKVQEILKLPHVTKLPKSANYILGLFDLRGKVIPVIDLAVKFGIDDRGTKVKDLRAIVVNINDKKVGLAIDAVSHVIKVESKDIEPAPAIVKGISGRYIVGIAKVDKGFVIILNINQIFSAEELMAMGKSNAKND
jgi:purine-binding chemotaxis protein CheW